MCVVSIVLSKGTIKVHCYFLANINKPVQNTIALFGPTFRAENYICLIFSNKYTQTHSPIPGTCRTSPRVQSHASPTARHKAENKSALKVL